LDAVTDRLFFQKKYDYYRVLEKITHELNSVINLPDALNVVARPLIDEMHLKSAGFYLREKTAEAAYVCRKKAGYDAETLPDYVEEENPAVNYLMENKEILEAGKFRHKFGHLYSGDKILDPQKAGIQKALDTTFQAGLLVPLILKQNLMGFAVLGEKRSGDQFTQRDLALLELMAGQMAITLENIKMYEQMLNNERLTIIGTMSAGIAHEIRNPLASINAFIQMLPMKYDKPKFRKRFDEIIPAEIERISGITENLLAFSKPSPLKLEQVFIRNVIDRVIMLLSNQLHKSQIEVVKILDNIPVIQADTQQITQVFLNLLLNAIQASNPGGKITIAAGTRSQGLNTLDRSGSHILVSVLDEGEGIKKTNLANVFQPFFTTKNEGTGLGLATSKRIIEAHHGKITVESKEGLGARFIVRLPLHLTLNEV
ncbi:GAF domain-containing protein, partial [bacterium]|nr:GAF domain-containing protein [bacterium]